MGRRESVLFILKRLMHAIDIVIDIVIYIHIHIYICVCIAIDVVGIVMKLSEKSGGLGVGERLL